MRRTTLAVVISSVLLGAVAAQAEPTIDPAQTPVAQTTAPTDTTQPAASSTSRKTDTTAGANNNENVGTPESNVDEKSSSGSYYPYSAGTVGDDPAEPESTSPTSNGGGDPAEPTDQWISGDADKDGYLSKDELTKISPSLASSFDAMDVDSNGKLTRGEFRTWHESHKTRMDADQPATTMPNDEAAAPAATTVPDETTVPDDKGN